MAKPSKIQQDRRAVIEQMRKDQKRAERKRSSAIVAVCVVVALVIIGLGAKPLFDQWRAGSGALATLGTAAKSAGCQPIVTKKADGNQVHRPVGTRIIYPESPPAFGPHWPTPAPFGRKIYTTKDRPPVEYLVHNLEHGYTLLWYDQTVADNTSEMNVVQGIAGKFQGGQKMTDKFIAAPWTAKDGDPFPKGTHVALTHWSVGGKTPSAANQQGVWQYCGQPSGAVVSSFMKKYPFTDSPEPTAM
ncbi:MAG: DUF3105 domain-containing protein [Nocardioidaceae bacterium]